MYLIQVLVPLYRNSGKKFSKKCYAQVRDTLLKKYGGLTVYSRAPVRGLWEKNPGQTVYDDLLIFEVMTKKLHAGWWRRYRATLEKEFAQEHLVIRAQTFQLL